MLALALSEFLPDVLGDLAFDVVERCFHKGLLFFAPVGSWGQTVKIAPPLTITQEALEEGLGVLSESVDEAVSAQGLASSRFGHLQGVSI